MLVNNTETIVILSSIFTYLFLFLFSVVTQKRYVGHDYIIVHSEGFLLKRNFANSGFLIAGSYWMGEQAYWLWL